MMGNWRKALQVGRPHSFSPLAAAAAASAAGRPAEDPGVWPGVTGVSP